jgi:hypothetical protein
LSTELLSVFLSPSQLLAVRWRGLPRRIVELRSKQIAVHTGNGWAEVLDEFSAMLRDIRSRRVRVILSAHFAHYQLVPWLDELQDSEEELAVVRLAFTKTFGDCAARWDIILSDDSPGRARVAAAIDSELFKAIKQAARDAEVDLVSMQPYLSAAVNHWRKHFNRNDSRWLVLHEENRVCLALIDHGHWRWVRCLRVGADWSEHLPEMLEHEMLLAGTGDFTASVLVFTPYQPVLSLPAGTRMPFHSLVPEAYPGFSSTDDSSYGLALIG